MKIAIAQTGFDEETKCWTDYCDSHCINYIIVNPYDTNIIEKVSGCDVFVWHHSQTNYKDLLFANQLLFALQQSGMAVYPDFNSTWHFDDKVGQKYLLEAVGAPLVKSYAFYDKHEALKWARETSYPKVFKLRCGAASTNVKLIHSFQECKRIINKAFETGFPPYDSLGALREGIKQQKGIKHIGFCLYRLLFTPKQYKYIKSEKGYVYFQDFMPDNHFDTRVIVIGGRYACAERRMNRKGDFRASGSGKFSYEDIDPKIVRTAFDASKHLKMQSVAFDFIYDKNGQPKIVEICFGFGVKGIKHSPGYYTNDMVWHTCDEVPIFDWIIDTVVGNTMKEA